VIVVPHCILARGIETEFCCLPDEVALEFDDVLGMGTEVGDEGVGGGGELVAGRAVMGVAPIRLKVVDGIAHRGEGGGYPAILQ
jgi:hypothetical protein